jgi:hypothetical protein
MPKPHKKTNTINLRIIDFLQGTPENPNAQNSLSAGIVKAIPHHTAAECLAGAG